MTENKAYKKRVLIIGEYKAEKAIASSLIKRGCNVTVINENGNDAERLAEIRASTSYSETAAASQSSWMLMLRMQIW